MQVTDRITAIPDPHQLMKNKPVYIYIESVVLLTGHKNIMQCMV